MRIHLPFFTGSNDVKDLVRDLLARRAGELRGQAVLDVPAGNGDTARQLHELGAQVTAADLYPEFFRVPELPCVRANLNERLPFADASFDWVICQEGIEHMPNQLHLFQELNRVLRPGGRALLTTPNYSNLRTRLSYLLLESEAYRLMPPNEADAVWAADGARRIEEVYLGHIFFANLSRQRVLAALSGLGLAEVHPARVNWTSLLLLPFWYPWLGLAGWAARRRGLRKAGATPRRQQAYDELTQLNRSLNVLTGGHLLVEYEKRQERAEAAAGLSGKLTLATART